MKYLDLANVSEKAIVDDKDYERLRHYKWHRQRVREQPGGRAGYVYCCTDNRTIYLHRFILDLTDRRQLTDHINGDTLDNRRANLRITNTAVNIHNRHHHNRRNTSGVRGVFWDKERHKWCASLCVDRTYVHMGRFDTLEEATAARRAAELKHFGEYCPIPAGQST